ncbi:S1 family peptidase [Spirillospora sp. NPDC047279]|uniref:S1 family peptidase n=1 Tax=Spirillospora sp. NPDC047279 TaxID=3155478 RepID=UPI0033FB6A23
MYTRRTTAIAAATGLAATALAAAPAVQAAPAAPAAPARTTAAQTNAAHTALAAQLGARSGGAYVDGSTGRTVVTVTDADAAATVRAAGAVPKQVTRSGSDLKKIKNALKGGMVDGTALSIDTAANQVVFSADRTVGKAGLAKLRKSAAKYGAAVRVRQSAGEYRMFTAGGEPIYTSGGRCSLGFNVKKGSEFFFLTAGHCVALAGPSWFADQGQTQKLGDATGSSFPGDDYAIVKYDAAPADTQGVVSLYGGGTQDITGAGDPTVGQAVTRSGSTTQVHDGEVTGLDATVQYQEGTVEGLIQTTVCAEPGDSGGALFAGGTALGLTSGGSGNCTSGGETFFQPVSEALSVYGVEVY